MDLGCRAKRLKKGVTYMRKARNIVMPMRTRALTAKAGRERHLPVSEPYMYE
jgi:hypothetical protein